jgi:putative integral membrane protein (TIGR02587 family)
MSITGSLKLPFRAQNEAQARLAGRRFRYGVARALAGAIIFALPMFMTQEMWELGLTIPALRMALLLLLALPLLLGLSRLSGFERTGSWLQDGVDVFVAYFVGVAAAALLLTILSRIPGDATPREIAGLITLQAIPASIGALLAQSQFGQHDEDDSISVKGGGGYWGELLVMSAGALFLAFNVAPTEEVMVLAYDMSREAVVGLALLSIVAMHAFVYAVGFRGQETIPEGGSPFRAFMLLTVTGYALVLLLSAFVLWTFGRFENSSLSVNLGVTTILAFPGSIGAAAARLIL